MVSATTYITICSQPAFDGILSLEIDPTYHELKIPYWFNGLEGKSPYRIRVIYTPNNQAIGPFIVKSIIIKDVLGVEICELPKSQSERMETDKDGKKVFIIGHQNVPIQGDKIKCLIEASIGNLHNNFLFEIYKNTKKSIIHAGWETLSSI
jgi:hypothetical protein